MSSKITLNVLLIAGILCLTGCSKVTSESPTDFISVTTTEGSVKGVKSDGIIAFKGIPYAAAPVGPLRWRAPQKPPEREEMLIADTYGNRCMQRPVNPDFQRVKEQFTQDESEDCLYLNIYRPDTTASDLAVMVWIPGGGLVSGSGSRPVNHGGNLVRKDVVVVSINYRLGSFGFFAHPELSKENPDNGKLFNYGLMDQIAALEWVQQNIAGFGGDPDNVTIFGESAGGGSVDMLVASQAGKGLFHKAISQSGYGRGRQPRVAAIAEEGDKVVESMGSKLADALDMQDASLAELRAIAASDIVKATDFSTYIDFAVDGTVISKDMMVTLHSGQQAAIPMIIGSTDFEFGMVPPEAQRGIMSTFFSADEMAVLTPYFGSEAVRDKMLYSDYAFHSQNREFALAHERAGYTTFVYRFGMPAMGFANLETDFGTVYGAPHASDMPYTFGNFTGDHMEPKDPGADQLAVSELMMNYWTNFAKTGNPNGSALPEWPEYQGTTIMRFIPEKSGAVEDAWAERLDKINALIE